MRKFLDPYAALFACAVVLLAWAVSRPPASPLSDRCPCGGCKCQAGQCDVGGCPQE